MTDSLSDENLRKAVRPPGQSHLRWTLLGCALLFVAWWLISRFSGPLLLASPRETARAMMVLFREGVLLEQCSVTMGRVLAILGMAGATGAALAGLGIWDTRIAATIEPWRRVFSTIPPIVLVVVVMFWMGMGTEMIMAFGTLLLWPIMYIGIIEGQAICGADLRETAKVFQLSMYTRVRHFYLPSIAPACLSSAVQLVCSAIRVTILAEVLGAENGIGAAIVTSSRNLAIDRMTAWVLIALAIAMFAEFALLGPIRKRAYRWKTA